MNIMTQQGYCIYNHSIELGFFYWLLLLDNQQPKAYFLSCNLYYKFLKLCRFLSEQSLSHRSFMQQCLAYSFDLASSCVSQILNYLPFIVKHDKFSKNPFLQLHQTYNSVLISNILEEQYDNLLSPVCKLSHYYYLNGGEETEGNLPFFLWMSEQAEKSVGSSTL